MKQLQASELEKFTREWDSDPSLREEFNFDKGTWLNYCQAKTAGLVKIFGNKKVNR